jgi:hypothetical protein
LIGALDWMAGEKVEGAPTPTLDHAGAVALRAWNLMGGEIQWPAVPWIAEWLGCDDVDELLEALVTIRDYANNEREQG